MKIKPLIFLLSLFLLSCGQSKTNDAPKLYTRTFTSIETPTTKIDKDTLTIINSDYFEVSLSSVSDGAKYEATKKLVKPTSSVNFKMVYFNVTDSKGEILYFPNSTDFLNFMSARGYEMADQQKNKYGADYTFRKSSK